MVHELGICVFVCIFVVSLCAFEGFVYLHSGGGGGGGGGVFVGILWLFCVHFSQFCDLMGIQILHT